MDDQYTGTANKSDDLFELRLTPAGIQSIRRFVKAVKWVIILFILFALCQVLYAVIYIRLPRSYPDRPMSIEKIIERFYPFYLIVYTILAGVQLRYYYFVSKQLGQSVENHDNGLFNLAFRSLFRHAAIGIFMLLTSVIMGALHLYTIFRYLL